MPFLLPQEDTLMTLFPHIKFLGHRPPMMSRLLRYFQLSIASFASYEISLSFLLMLPPRYSLMLGHRMICNFIISICFLLLPCGRPSSRLLVPILYDGIRVLPHAAIKRHGLASRSLLILTTAPGFATLPARDIGRFSGAHLAYSHEAAAVLWFAERRRRVNGAPRRSDDDAVDDAPGHAAKLKLLA